MEKPWLKFYPEGISSKIEIPTTTSIYQILEKSESKYSSNIAVIDGEHRLSYFELKNTTEYLASALYNRGFKKGDRLALMLSNSMEYILTFFAVHRLGGTIVQVNPMYQTHELDKILKDSESSWFIGYKDEEKKLDNIGLTEKIVKFFIDGKDEQSFYALIDEKGTNLPDLTINPTEDIAVLQYTGGTTGIPKGVILTHFNIVANINQISSFGELIFKNGPNSFLGISPMFHAMGMTNLVLNLSMGGTYISLKRFEVKAVIELIRKHRPTLFTGSPTMYIALLNYPELREDDFHSLKLCVSGAAPMPVEVIKKFRQVTNALMIEGYGQSEATTSSHRNPMPGKLKVGSIGIPITNTDAKIVDIDFGKTEVPIGEAGELIVKGPQVMKGYWKSTGETEKAIRNGWLYTGDIATRDEDGYFYIVGRKKEMIIASGYNIYPMEVEEVLYEHPLVKEACVFGIPDTYRGETVKAILVMNGTASEEEIKSWCAERLAKYKVPRIIEFRDEIPKTSVGKVLRHKLVEEELSRLQIEK
ncbi:long-chain fatty acid--CoA ligase [Psychrobacillus sp. NPDC096426]|uniref:long-chain-fatty-acid--CoA ligase n=1 Tax=Psychrobacillus sp. NPDC096426 TaxID=3364491 RepID=UPI003801916A